MTAAPTPRQYGSLSTLTQDRLDLYESALSLGMPRTKAAELLTVTHETWSMARKEFCEQRNLDWKQITLEQIQNIQDNESTLTTREKNILKILTIEKGPADAEGELTLLAEIKKAEPWQSKAWLLERTRGYTIKQEIEVSGMPQPVTFQLNKDETAAYLENIRALQEQVIIIPPKEIEEADDPGDLTYEA